MAEQYQERQVAVKLRVNEICEGNYVVEEGWKPNYLLTKKGGKASRVNLMGVVLDKEENGAITNLVLDDGSGKIIVRSFEEIKNLKDIKTGEGILVIGRIRVYNDEKYISPEIIKKIDNAWLKVRGLESKEEVVIGEKKKEVKEETEDKEEIFEPVNKKILDLIKELDKGEGALIEEVKEKLKINNTEEIIEEMLKRGEIFQNIAGRAKVL
jgi:RPA family protein